MAKNSFNDLSDESEEVTPWELPQIEGENGALPKSVLTADEIADIQKQAYDEAFQQGLQEGREKGFQKGLNESRDQIGEKLAQLNSMIATFDKPFKNLDQKIEEELVALSMLVAKQLVRRELKIDPGQVIAVVREAMSILPVSSQKVSLRLHPDDAALVRSAFALEEVDLAWTIAEDPLLSRGGCEIVTETSRIDATVEKRLSAVISTALGGEREADAD